jgi:hypothetical protein
MIKIFLRFFVLLTLMLGMALCVQLYFQFTRYGEYTGHFILPNYLFNYTLTLVFFFVFIQRNKKVLDNLGFAFLFFSLLKFILFLVLLYPHFELENGIKSPAFTSFFVPYALCLFYETYIIVKQLKD